MSLQSNASFKNHMKPYSKNRTLKGISGRRKSKASKTRERCLRTDKKSARQNGKMNVTKEIISDLNFEAYQDFEDLLDFLVGED